MDINVTNYSGETPLHKAAERGHRKMVDFLVQSGAVVDLQDDYGRTALHRAVSSKGHAMRLLVNRKADVFARDMFGQTALHMAAKAGLRNDVYFLLGHGASADDKDDSGQTARDLAAKAGETEVVKLLNSMTVSDSD
ncbi:ankyrin repeat protein [Aspergillus nomiae NRRL 13137]|uniref:Ankyrin repeat protein n=1 Tax=Aspergillus nomiae NRRL (strain ATCC 15546 / NRRL 13137 / CBS 260.88 / M93) TaxID=1509407 RepID=A0A0L1J2K4_ASPN3|nr:ankyrin repeat protein [Aspergillus nomiae NRRL 13137]KNG85962.1 ankyrin repeat protein [Aspergillus nomiae NRRL 13137]